MFRVRLRVWLPLSVVLASVVAGYLAAGRLTPARLRAEVEHRLGDALGAPVSIGELRVGIGLTLGLELDGRDLRVWPAGPDAALVAERVLASVRPFSHLTGQLRLGQIRLDGVRLVAKRDGAGRWTPEPLGRLLEGSRRDEAHQPPHPHELLSPLIALEAGGRQLLAGAHLADRIELTHGQVVIEDALERRTLRLENLAATAQHRPLLGSRRITLRGWLADADRPLGSVELEAELARGGALRMEAAGTDLELGGLDPWLGPNGADARIEGTVSGALSFRAPEPGRGRLEVDLQGRHVASRRPSSSGAAAFTGERVALSGVLEIDPDAVQLRDGRFASDEHGLELEGLLERPLRPASLARFGLALHDLGLDDARALIGWLPDVTRQEAEQVLASLESGRLRTLRTGGSATLGEWRDFLAGRTRTSPRGFLLDAELADTVLHVGESDRIEDLSGRLVWAGDRLETHDLRARLNGAPLPRLELRLDGISSFFAVAPERRELASGAPPLQGLRPLWEVFRPPAGETGTAATPRIDLEVERLEHPMFLWPIEDLRAGLTPNDEGLTVTLPGGTWGGVRVSGQAEWLFEPEESVHVHLAAAEAEPSQEPATPGRGWARGRIEIGPVEGRRWGHRRLSARFDAAGGDLQLHHGRIELTPGGRAEATARLDLTRAEGVPFQLSTRVEAGQLSSLAALVGLSPDLATGSVDLAGSVEGNLVPGERVFPGLSGLVDLDARDGSLRRSVPALMAVALASEVFNPFEPREVVRFDRLETLLEFDAGRLRTQSLALDGPDVRAFANGSVDLADSSHEVDIDLVLFLFRPVDSVVGRIPILNLVLLGPDQNLLAAYYELSGPWKQPKAALVPMRSIATGPASLVFEQLPAIVRRGFRALGGLLGRGPVAEGGGATPGKPRDGTDAG